MCRLVCACAGRPYHDTMLCKLPGRVQRYISLRSSAQRCACPIASLPRHPGRHPNRHFRATLFHQPITSYTHQHLHVLLLPVLLLLLSLVLTGEAAGLV